MVALNNRRASLPLLEPCDRREFVAAGVALVAASVLGACGSAEQTAPPAPAPAADAFTVEGSDVVIVVSRVPALATIERPAVLLEARVIVVRVSATEFRAMSVECPHAGCAVSIADGPRLICPCHASAFDATGRRLEGPAPTGLTALTAAFDATTGRLRVRRA